MAIKACRPEQEKLLHNRQKMEVVNESLDEGYCDISGQVEELDHLGTVGETKVFVTRGCSFYGFNAIDPLTLL